MLFSKRLLGLVAVISLLVVATAAGDQQIKAAPSLRYTTPSVTIAQGERLTFLNSDSVQHDVTSRDDFENKALFSTPLIGRNGEAFVEGTQYLKTGSYAFYCSVHPDMQGTINVSSAGTPVPRPGATVKPKLTASSAKLSSIKKNGKLGLTLKGAVGVSAKVTASATIAGKKTTLGSKTVKIGSSGKKSLSVTLSSKLRKAIAKASKLAVSFKAKTTESTPQTATAKRTYK